MLSLLPAKYYFAPKIDEKNYGKPVPVSELKLQRLQRLDPKNAKPVTELIAEGSDSDGDAVSDDESGSSSTEDETLAQQQPKKQKPTPAPTTDFTFSKVVTTSEMLAPGKKQNKQHLLKVVCIICTSGSDTHRQKNANENYPK